MSFLSSCHRPFDETQDICCVRHGSLWGSRLYSPLPIVYVWSTGSSGRRVWCTSPSGILKQITTLSYVTENPFSGQPLRVTSRDPKTLFRFSRRFLFMCEKVFGSFGYLYYSLFLLLPHLFPSLIVNVLPDGSLLVGNPSDVPTGDL